MRYVGKERGAFARKQNTNRVGAPRLSNAKRHANRRRSLRLPPSSLAPPPLSSFELLSRYHESIIFRVLFVFVGFTFCPGPISVGIASAHGGQYFSRVTADRAFNKFFGFGRISVGRGVALSSKDDIFVFGGIWSPYGMRSVFYSFKNARHNGLVSGFRGNRSWFRRCLGDGVRLAAGSAASVKD